MDYIHEFQSVLSHVTTLTTLLGNEIDMSKVEIIDRGVPHTPKSLKPKTMGVYTFSYDDQFLKIGKAGPNSKPRFLSQHYTGSAKSTLAGSLLSDPDMSFLGLTEKNVGSWIRENCRRVDILLDVNLGIFTLELVEAALHYKYKPKYEGFSSQR